MEALELKEEQGIEICEKVSRILVKELDNEEVWTKIEKAISEYIRENNIKENAANLVDKLEWSVQVRLKK